MGRPARIDFTNVWEAIRSWVLQISGLPDTDVAWADWPQGYKGPVQVRLSPIALPTVVEEAVYEDTGTTLNAAKCAMRLLSVSIAVRTRSQDPAEFALGYAAQLEDAAETETELLDLAGVLDDAGIVVSQVLRRPSITAYEWQGRAEQQCTLDLEFALATSTPLGEVGWFNRVQVSSGARSVDGSLLPSALQVEDEEIGPP